MATSVSRLLFELFSSAGKLYVAFTSELTREGYRLALSSFGKAPATIQNEARTQVIVIIWKCDGLITHRCAGARPKDWPLEMCICYLTEH